MRWLMTMAACLPLSVHAAHPLVTDDTGTQGQGRYQIELATEHATDVSDAGRERSVTSNAVLSYGWRDDVDVIVNVPFARTHAEGEERSRGVGDVGIDLKWRWFERDAFSMALRPGLILATGDDTKGLGAGRSGYSVLLVASYASDPWGVHAHVGAVRNRNTLGERDTLYHASAAVTRAFGDKLKLVADLGRDTPADPADDRSVEFLIIGAIYALTPQFDLDIGYKKGLSDNEVDRALLAGAAFRF